MIIILCLIAALQTAPTSSEVSVASVFVGPQLRDGFIDVDTAVTDSIKDLKDQLKGRRHVRVVSERGDAQVIVEVLSRGYTTLNGGGAAGVPIGTSTFVIPIGTIGISTLLRVGKYEKSIVFQNCQAWKHCADLVARDVETWIGANLSLLPAKQ